MIHRTRTTPTFLAALASFGAAFALQAGTAFVLNPSFENNFTEPWPFYGSVSDWQGGRGVNTAAGPFHNADTPVPDGLRVAFQQGSGTLSQEIYNLTPGQQYWIQFRYDRRNSQAFDLVTKFNDVELDKILDPKMAVGGAPYYFRNVVFTPEADYGVLTFEVAAYGDSTALIDAVTIVPRGEGNFVVQNPSFEASGTVYEGAPSVGTDWPAISGWTKTGVAGVDDGTGGYADNGTIPDQALAVFIDGVGSLAQTLNPLVVNDTYQVQFAYNAKSGTTPHLQLKVGDTVVWEQDVTPVGGTAAYRTASVSFQAPADTATVTFANTVAGAAVLLDDVKVLGKTGSQLPPIAITPLSALLRIGEETTGTVTIPSERLATGDAVIQLRSDRPAIAELVGADENGLLSLTFGYSGGASAPPTGAKLWLKADAITGLADGAKVANWADSSGNANDASQATAANQPTYVANGQNSLPTVRFDDLDADSTANGVQFLDSKATVQTKSGASFTALVVFRSDDAGVSAGALEGRDNLFQPLDADAGNLGRTVLFLDTDASGNHKLQSVSAQASLVADSNYTPATWKMATVVQDASAATLALFVNGNTEKVVSMGAEGGQNGAWRIGATKQGHGGLKGEIAEILVYDRALTAAERQEAESYLGKKWGLPAATALSYAVKAISVGSSAIQIAESAGLLLPNDTPTIFVAGSTFVLNPSFELDKDSGVGSAPVTGWTTAGGIGMADAANPFGPAADTPIPDRLKVLRIQGSGTVSQTIEGLKPGQEYGLQFFYNPRTWGYPDYDVALEVWFAGQQLANLQSLAPASAMGLTEYYFKELRFTPSAASGLLEFKVVVTSGDATLFLDAVSIVPRLAGEIAVMNSSFEGTAMGAAWPGYIQPGRVAGWTGARSGYGPNAYSPRTFFVEPFFDNGINSDQDNVIFMQGAGSLEQTITGLAAGQPHTLVFDYNGRDGRPQNNSDPFPETAYELYLDYALVDTQTFVPANTVSPWPGFLHTLPLYQAFVPFTPAADIMLLQLNHVVASGDRTLLVDNVRIVPGTRTPPTITTELVPQTVDEGATVTFTTAATGTGLTYRWLIDGVQLTDGGSISGATTATLTLSNAKVADSGTYTVLVTDGLGVVGSAAALTVQLTAAPAIDNIEVTGGNLVLTWTGNAKVVISDNIAAPMSQWQDAPGANNVSPYSVPVAQIPGNVIFARLVAQ